MRVRAQRVFPENAIRKEIVEAAAVIGTELKAVQNDNVYAVFMMVLASLMTDAETSLYVNTMSPGINMPYPDGTYVIAVDG
jgi:hypothetical protein